MNCYLYLMNDNKVAYVKLKHNTILINDAL